MSKLSTAMVKTLTPIFEKLGPGRLADAVNHPQLRPEYWGTCILALAYGAPGRLEEAAAEKGLEESAFAALIFGLTDVEVCDITDYFDNNPRVFSRLARAWLEQHAPHIVLRRTSRSKKAYSA